MSNDKFNGYHLKLSFLRNNNTGSFEPVYELYDSNKLVGVFEEEMFANRYWIRTYIPSRRTQVKINDTYDMGDPPNED